MPFINIKMTPGPTAEQKAEFIKRVTALAAEVLGKNPATTHVVMEEVPADGWGIAGETVATRKKRGA
ncbi:MAG: 4-oxalocrotonate tautomerase family protein [Elusimicrobia bacterium]|nr:4-oxalocrotonate tautomerase family protein [Elusimicrobiota bacterium]